MTSSSGAAGHRRRVWLRGALLVLGACLLALVAELAGWLGFYDRAQYDLWHRLAGTRRAPEHVALVAVDDATLLAHEHEPMAFWQEHFAAAVSTLRAAGAKVVGLDYLFQVSAGEWLRQFGVEDSIARTQDIGLRREFASGDVVPIGHMVSDEKGEAQIMLPIPELLYSLPRAHADIGLANLALDPDGVVRRFQPALFPEGGTPNVTFPTLLALRAAGLDPESSEWSIGGGYGGQVHRRYGEHCVEDGGADQDPGRPERGGNAHRDQRPGGGGRRVFARVGNVRECLCEGPAGTGESVRVSRLRKRGRR